MKQVAVIILTAGRGTRMKSALPKVMHKLAGRPMINYLLDSVKALNPDRVIVIVGQDMEIVKTTVSPYETVVQIERLGTGHAVSTARASLANFNGTILILHGDTPLIGLNNLKAILDRSSDLAIVVLGFRSDNIGRYGRLLINSSGKLESIVEFNDATDEQRAINLCNSGVIAVDAIHLWKLIDKLSNNNSSGEFYLTDIISLAHKDGLICDFIEASRDELLGINSMAELAISENILQNRMRLSNMENGVMLIDPTSIYFSWDTQLGQNVIIGPNVVFGPGVSVGDNCKIEAFCHLEGASIASNSTIGPFARLRPNVIIGNDVCIGNFVEIKNSTIESGTKINHLTYIGDSQVGSKVNIGAGTITCNYNGLAKFLTKIDNGAFIGSNSSLIAPVKIGKGSIVGAGSVITKDVSAGSLAITRGEQKELSDWANHFFNIDKKSTKEDK
jgi:bifunctional UDP-N-acetylglucosamine pyrophosphorylase/glucosamine-1-phosphate N-acetyltransferase